MYYKEAVGAMIVYDVTREKTFQAVPKWKDDIDENLASIPVLLLANKVRLFRNFVFTLLQCDLLEKPEDLDRTMLDNFCKEHGFIGWCVHRTEMSSWCRSRFNTSAKDDVNIDKAGHFLVKSILARDPKAQKPDHRHTGTIDLNKSSLPKEEKEKSCC